MSELQIRICDKCHVALFYPHPQARGWVKCELCGYCQETDRPDHRILDAAG